MPALTQAQRDIVAYVIDYLDKGSAGNIDSFSIEQLTRVFKTACDFVCGCPGSFQIGMQNSPSSTLLKAILCVNVNALSVAEIAIIQHIIDYLDAGSAGAIDSFSIEQLARVFQSSCDFVCGCPGSFQIGMQNAPESTLLKALLCVDSGSLVPG